MGPSIKDIRAAEDGSAKVGQMRTGVGGL